ncbi:MAG TPA: hypothetical protein ENH41_03465 [Candidatus Omnitrophica bacterium]|nr:hypothetical protein [Candidatus Omnitrophota bacterium]
MGKQTITEYLQEAEALKQQQKELNAKLKAKKQAIATEYMDNLSPEAKAQQIAEAEAILNTAKAETIKAKDTFKATMLGIKERVKFSKSILDFVNYKIHNGLPKVNNQYVVNENILTFHREGIKDIAIDISKADWQKVFKAELKKQGINGNDRVADNIIYKAKCLLESNNAV